MWWPDNPEDSKSLFLSLIAGLSVILFTSTLELILFYTPNNLKHIIYWASLIVVISFFIICIKKYSKLKKGLDDIHIKNKKSLKLLNKK